MFPGRLSWRTSLTTAALACYLPFLAVTIYTLLCVPCTHCKETYAWILPVGPGAVAGFFSLHWLDSATGLALRNEWLMWTTAGLHTVLIVLVVAAIGRLGWLWLAIAAVAALLVFGLQAVAVLQVIQA